MQLAIYIALRILYKYAGNLVAIVNIHTITLYLIGQILTIYLLQSIH